MGQVCLRVLLVGFRQTEIDTVPRPLRRCDGKNRRKNKLASGTVKWFNSDKGYGFIQPSDGGSDIFVHISQVQSSGLQGLENDQAVEFELIDGLDGRQMAGNISIKQ